MNDIDHAQTIADEDATERQYSKALAARAKSLQRLTNEMTDNTWTTSTKVDVPREGELIGRVALNGPDELLDGGRDFYIGTAKHEEGDYRVYSWAAPVACTYYRKSVAHHPLCESVVGVRVLAHRGGRIADYQDEIVSEEHVGELFSKRQLRIPRAPVPRRSPLSKSDYPESPMEEEPTTIKGDVQETSARPILVPAQLPAPSAPVDVLLSRPVPGPSLRAPDLLRRQLAAPKTVAMSAVLATLQSDQYDAITKPASADQVLQGHPGTGKTIIATHRAAYLLNAEAPADSRPRGHVLILGPTAEYVEHVQSVLRNLIDDSEKYEVKSMPALLEELAGLPQSTVPTVSVLLEDVSSDLANLVDLAFSKAQANLGAERPSADDVYAELIWLLQDPPEQGLDGEWARYLRALPTSLKELRRQRISSYRGLMAYIGVRTNQISHPGHVIVDEAQDVHPIEWEILGRLGNLGGWTILGDLNQRRTDHTFSSWDEVARLLAIEGDDGKAPVQLLERGYRSTAQIIRFANQLLPARDRGLYSLQQDGEEPKREKVTSARDIHGVAISAATTLLERVGTGTVAIIAIDLQSVSQILKRRGWRAESGNAYTWRNGEQILRLLTPERARGLEFDGVVVVEPAAFPENVGRQGVLYTALTRANRLLTVVHYRALPRGLRIR